MSDQAFKPFVLPNGSTLKNRIIKAAMEENLADVPKGNQPSQALIELYKRWGEGGAALILSGHIMIDQMSLACPGDVALAKGNPGQDDELWRTWINTTQREGAQFWLQINHPGRQAKAGSGLPSYAPSAIPINIGKLSSAFSTPIEMTEEKIQDIINRFIWTATKAEELGASGIQIHAAHGYLISQFLSPLSNKRTDGWGGSIENRAKLLFSIIQGIRAKVSPKFGVAIKINTSDFQRGGFDSNDLHWLVEKLNDFELDFLELSGGSAEVPAMRGSEQTHQDKPSNKSPTPSKPKSARTLAREAYFIRAAEELKDVASMPLLVTGGITNLSTVANVLSLSDRTLAGVATGFGLIPDLAKRWERGESAEISIAQSWVLPGILQFAASTACVQWNLHRLGHGQETWHGVWPAFGLVVSVLGEFRQMRQYKAFVASMKMDSGSGENEGKA